MSSNIDVVITRNDNAPATAAAVSGCNEGLSDMLGGKMKQEDAQVTAADGAPVERGVRPLAYALLWHSKKTWPHHSSQLVWADAVMLDQPGLSMFERYGTRGLPFTKDAGGEWFRVVPLWPTWS